MEHARKNAMMPAEAVRPVDAKQAPYMVSNANIVKQDTKQTTTTNKQQIKGIKISFEDCFLQKDMMKMVV